MQNKITKSQISWVRLHIFENRSNHIFSFFEPVVLMYINPINSKKCGTTFSQIFRFWFIDFSKKIFEIFFYPWGLPWGYVDQCKMLQVKKNNFWSRSCFLQTWNLFTWDTVQHIGFSFQDLTHGNGPPPRGLRGGTKSQRRGNSA